MAIICIFNILSQAVIFFYFFHDSFRVDPLFLLVLFLLVVSLQQLILVFSSSLQNQLNFKRLAAVKIIFSLVFFGLSIFGLTVNPSAISLFSAWSLALLIHFLLLLTSPSLLFRWVNISINRIKLLIADGFPIVFQGGLRFFCAALDKMLVISIFQASVSAEYVFSSTITAFILIVPSILTKVSLPPFIQMFSYPNRSLATRENTSIFLRRVISLNVLVTVFLSFIFISICNLCIPIFYDKYLGALVYFPYFIFSYAFSGMSQSFADMSMSIGLKKITLSNTILFLSLLILSTSLLLFFGFPLITIPIASMLLNLLWSLVSCAILIRLSRKKLYPILT